MTKYIFVFIFFWDKKLKTDQINFSAQAEINITVFFLMIG